MSTPVTIELGPQGQDRQPDRSRLPVGRYARLAAGALALLLAAAAGGSAPPARSPLVEVATRPTSPFHLHALAGDVLYSVRTDPAPPVVTAYDLVDGAELWTTPLTGAMFERSGGVVMESVRVAGDRVLVGRGLSTVALDTAGGRILWTTAGWVNGRDHGTGYGIEEVVLPDEGGPPVDGEEDSIGDRGVILRGIDLDTGAELWRSTPIRSYQPLDRTTGPRLLVVNVAGVIEVWDGHTGAVRARLVDGVRPRAKVPMTDGELVYIGADTTLTAYDVDTLNRRWRVPAPARDGVGVPCGAQVCFVKDGRTWFLDAATGAAVGGPVSGGPPAVHAGHVVLYGNGGQGRVVDPHTGRILVDLTEWSMPVGSEFGTRPVLARATDEPRSWFAVLDPGVAVVRVLGSVPYRPADCWASDTYITCQTGQEELRVWRYR
ncbi:PQQ-binding-like beta-propeller repeat protein [Polymorphospora rubra]|uniref:outer membrane protein assembly factor BamB family protein n=1 Tax=Polymorphospora rubra TaxID=338584 RepID=UPI003400F786